MSDSNNTINAIIPPTNHVAPQLLVDVNLHIGLFFDGTNNNKVQSMLALNDRRKRFFKKYKNNLNNKLGISAYPKMLLLSRMQLEANNIGTLSELDRIFGSASLFDLTMEEKIATDNDTKYRQASSADKNKKQTQNCLKDIARVFFSGKKTADLLMGGSTSQGSNYTNIAILCSMYETSEIKGANSNNGNVINRYYSIYIEGSGANDELTKIGNIIHLWPSIIGLGFGVDETGVSKKCQKAILKIKNIVEEYQSRTDVENINCYFDVFGFSRGATTARSFTHILNPNDDSTKNDKSLNKLFTGSENPFLEIKSTSKLKKKEIRTLGLYDTVASIGVLREETSYLLGDKVLRLKKKNDKNFSFFHDTNVDDFALYSTDLANRVLHICALDEYRKNFALVDIENSLNESSPNGIEMYIPGCHTDVGGGSKFGLDNFKIINCDEIATRGNVLFLLYVRVKGANTLIKSVQNISVIIGALSQIETLPAAYMMAKQLIRELHNATEGVFSLINGYENLAEYEAENGYTSRKTTLPSGPATLHSNLYKWLSNSYEAGEKIIAAGKQLPQSVNSVFYAYEDFLTNNDLFDKVNDIKSCIKIGKEIFDLLKTIKNGIEIIYSDLTKLKNSSPGTRWNGMRHEFQAFISEEIYEWQQLARLTEDSFIMFNKVFNGKREQLFVPLEHRRICMYTGEQPYGKISDLNKIAPVCLDTLKKMGWVDDKLTAEAKKTFWAGRPKKEVLIEAEEKGRTVIIDETKVGIINRHNIGICKYCKPGYSNLALKAMYNWANTIKMFSAYPDNIYPIPKANVLKSLDEKIEKALSAPLGSKVYCVPEIKDYKIIRNEYLHISMNQQVIDIADNGLVNGPSYMPIKNFLSESERELLKNEKIITSDKSYVTDSLITRRVYIGIKGAKTAGGRDFKKYDSQNTKWLLE